MLQQTTVGAVIPYYQNWLEKYPTVRRLAGQPLQNVLKAWQGLGYYARAKNLHAAARAVVNDHGGRLPTDYGKLRKLPGFGPYTAAAVLSLAYDLPYPVLDANVRRVLMRLARVRGQVSPGNDRRLLAHLMPLYDSRRPGLFNQAMMELGALVCRPRNPLCLQCPLPEFCAAFQNGEQEVIPRPRKRSYQKAEAVVAIIRDGNRYFIQKRPSAGLLADLWEFPGGKMEPGESPVEALKREIREELGVEIARAAPLLTVRHAYTRFQVTLRAFECSVKQKPGLRGHDRRWAALGALRRYPFPSGSAKIVRFLEERANKSPAG